MYAVDSCSVARKRIIRPSVYFPRHTPWYHAPGLSPSTPSGQPHSQSATNATKSEAEAGIQIHQLLFPQIKTLDNYLSQCTYSSFKGERQVPPRPYHQVTPKPPNLLTSFPLPCFSEANYTNCSTYNGGCEHFCHEDPKQSQRRYCSCASGYQLMDDHSKCEPVGKKEGWGGRTPTILILYSVLQTREWGAHFRKEV